MSVIKHHQGLESITFVTNPFHVEGGTFFLGDQTANMILGNCMLPIKSGGDSSKTHTCDIEINLGF